MRIVIDFQAAQSTVSRNRGIGNYTIALIKEIIDNRDSHEIFLVLNELFIDTIEPIRAEFEGLLPKGNIKIWHSSPNTNFSTENNNWRRQAAELSLEAYISSLDPDIILIASLFEGFADDAVTSNGKLNHGIPTIIIFYDLIRLIFYKNYLNDPQAAKWYESKLEYLSKASLVLAISSSSQRDAINLLGIPANNVVNISGAADPIFQPIAKNTGLDVMVLSRYGISRSFAMYTGGADYRKNIEGLIIAFAKLPANLLKKYQLVIICKLSTEYRTTLEILVKQNNLTKDDIIFTGYVPDHDLVILYNLCDVFVFPSLYEGFGLPVLEAMSCGKAVIGSNNSSIPEIINFEDALFDPNDPVSIATKLEHVLTDDAFRKTLEKHGLEQSKMFSWKKSALLALDAINELEKNQKEKNAFKPDSSSLPSLAFVSPLPPERSGISDYSAELIPELAKYYKIDVIVDQDSISDVWINSNCPIRDYVWFKLNSHTYDRVLYHIGNSHFHTSMFSSLETIPGVVVLHDFYLSHIMHHMEMNDQHTDFFVKSLFHSHGYTPFIKSKHLKNILEVLWEYPCNLDVIQNATGIIVHSQYSVQLAKKWYGTNAIKNWAVIPMLKIPAKATDKKLARKHLNINDEDFVVCSFGIIGPTKLNKRLLDCWLTSSLSKDQKCRLIFVGEYTEGYGQELAKDIENSGFAEQISITGWTELETFKEYLAAADLGVQLRTMSRGETSAAIFDCLNYGLATIANANGSIADISGEHIYKIPDDFIDSGLTEALEILRNDNNKRLSLSTQAQKLIQTNHSPSKCAMMYAQSIESFYLKKPGSKSALIQAISNLGISSKNENDIRELSSGISRNYPVELHQKQLLVDISAICQNDLQTGIQRVVRSILTELLVNPPTGYRVEPVYTEHGELYYYAREFTMRFLDNNKSPLTDEPIEYQAGDMFLALDLFLYLGQSKFIIRMINDGVHVIFTVYDLLPVLLPKYFPEGSKEIFEKWLYTISKGSGVICISKSTSDDAKNWIESNVNHYKHNFKYGWFHLGADIEASVPSKGLPANYEKSISAIKCYPSFLMVGTIEPRKGHSQALDAFEELWKNGTQTNLVIVGKQGWMVESIVERIKKHPENNRHLFWFNGITDEFLKEIYSVCSCLLAPSEGEGFGLPLIEAARINIPIIARNLPVFLEVAGDHAFYFDGLHGTDLASAITAWLDLYRNGKVPQSAGIPYLSWAQSAQQLKAFILDNTWE
jgi:glycosyltransferase involved in cell wall biosynthesis